MRGRGLDLDAGVAGRGAAVRGEADEFAAAGPAPDRALADVTEKKVAGGVAGGDAFDEAGAAGEFGEDFGGALLFAMGGEEAENAGEVGRALKRGEVGVALDRRDDAEGGEAAKVAEGGGGVAGADGERGEVVQVARGIGAELQGLGGGGEGGGVVFFRIRGPGFSLEVEVGTCAGLGARAA